MDIKRLLEMWITGYISAGAALTKFKVIPSLFSAVNCKKQNRGSQAWSARICQGQQRQLEGSSLQSTAMEQPT